MADDTMEYTTGELDGVAYLQYCTGSGEALGTLPCVLVLHWMGARPQDMLPLWAKFAQPARFLIPFGFQRLGDGYTWFGPDFYDRSFAEQGDLIRATAERLAGFLDALSQEAPCAGKPLVTGMSQGGDLSLALAIYHTEAIGAAIPLAGRLLPEFCPAEANLPAGPRPPVWIFHGENDAVVPLDLAQQAVSWLQRHEFPVQLRSYPETGHDITRQMVIDVHQVLHQLMA